MLTQVRAILSDNKRMSRITEGLGELFTRAEQAGWIEPTPAFIHDYHRDYRGLAELEAAHADVRRESLDPLANSPAAPELPHDVQRQIFDVDNWVGLIALSRAQKIFCAQPGQNVLAGRRHSKWISRGVSTMASPGCAQRVRRVCTACPQACAQHDSTACPTR